MGHWRQWRVLRDCSPTPSLLLDNGVEYPAQRQKPGADPSAASCGPSRRPCDAHAGRYRARVGLCTAGGTYGLRPPRRAIQRRGTPTLKDRPHRGGFDDTFAIRLQAGGFQVAAHTACITLC